MSDRDRLKSPRGKSGIQIDRAALVELMALRKRVLETFALIGPVLELARDKNELDPVRHLRTVELLSLEGKQMVERFANLSLNLYRYIPGTRPGWSGNKSKRRSPTV
jgi:hypothetical protein